MIILPARTSRAKVMQCPQAQQVKCSLINRNLLDAKNKSVYIRSERALILSEREHKLAIISALISALR